MRLLRLLMPVILLMSMISIAFGAATATLTVPTEGEFYYWFSYNDINGKPVSTVPRKFTDKTITIELPMVKDKAVESKLFVYDIKTGNEAIHAIKANTGGSAKIELKPSDFSFVRRVGIRITSAENGKSAASAIVTLQAGDAGQKQIIDPSAEGIAYFSDVPSGTVKVNIEYGLGKSSSQDIDIATDRNDIVPIIKVPVAGDIETLNDSSNVQANGAADKSPAGNSAQNSRSGKVGSNRDFSPVTALFGVILLAVLVYVGYRFLRNRGANVKALLKNAGIDLPADSNTVSAAPSAPQSPVDPTICPFCGTKKDPVTGACACSINSASGGQAGAASISPRLVATIGPYMGSVFTIDSDIITIGRDESNNISLAMDNTVSRRHARITRAGGTYTIDDEGSSNGTFVNGVKAANAVLVPGDEIQIGNSRFRFEI